MQRMNSLCSGNLDINKKINILLVHPVEPQGNNTGLFEYPTNYLLPTTKVDQTFCLGGPIKVCGIREIRKASLHVVTKTKWAESQGYHAVIIDCSIEPGIAKARKQVKIPVIGTMESSRAIASLLGKRVSSIYPKRVPVLELEDDLEFTYNELLKQGRVEVSKGANMLLLDCNILDRFAQRLQKDLDVPVLLNRDSAIKIAELLAAFGIRHFQQQPWTCRAKNRWYCHLLSKKMSLLAFHIKSYLNIV